ncbi:MAG: PaaI family thioesterase [Candidatus Pacebacteria bacterium]|nr:PaaI family thioesterase [Candidatus Paceibacterota bacterium]
MKESIKLPTESESIPITDFAKEDGREVLLAHIENAFELYKTMGLSPESFQYFEEEQKLEIQFTPSENQEGNAGVTHGGVLAFMIDASAGALAMATIDKEDVALTESTNTINDSLVRTGVPVSVISTRIDEGETPLEKRLIYIRTEVHQDSKLVAQADTKLKSVNLKTLERIHNNGNHL